jgi:hypothetical protein
MPWKIVKATPREYREREGVDIDVGWAWDVGSGEETRTVHVEVAAGHLHAPDLPDEAMGAIRSQGRSVLARFLEQDDPPTRIVISSEGVTATSEQ